MTVRSDNPNVSKTFNYDAITPGIYSLLFKKPGYHDLRKRIIIKAGENLNLQTVKMKERWLPTHVLKLKLGEGEVKIKLLNRTDTRTVYEQLYGAKGKEKVHQMEVLNSEIEYLTPIK